MTWKMQKDNMCESALVKSNCTEEKDLECFFSESEAMTRKMMWCCSGLPTYSPRLGDHYDQSALMLYPADGTHA